MKIGNLEFENNVFLAPMAGVTDISFRGLCKEMGCGLVYTEMVSAKALYYENENTKSLLRISEEESPVAVQIFGNNPKIMAEVVQRHFNEREDISLIDINMGCPVNKITKNGEGSALLKHPELAANIVREIKKVSTKPVTVKFRKGFDEGSINAVEFAKYLEDAGVDAEEKYYVLHKQDFHHLLQFLKLKLLHVLLQFQHQQIVFLPLLFFLY